MPKGTCSVEGCPKPHDSKGYCGAHYVAWRKYGDPIQPDHRKREPKPCAVDGCDDRAIKRGMCEIHYRRVKRTGSPEARRRGVASRPIFDRIMEKVSPPEDIGGCWEWHGAGRGPGNDHGVVFAGSKAEGTDHREPVYRALYEEVNGQKVPPHLVMDHLCRNPSCVYVAHLEPVTHAENLRRGLLGVLKKTCKNGHPWTPENLRVYADGRNRCIMCIDAWNAKRRGVV